MFLDYQREKASYQLILLLFHVRTSHILKQPQIEVFEKRETNYYSATNKIELVLGKLKVCCLEDLVLDQKSADSLILCQVNSLHELKP